MFKGTIEADVLRTTIDAISALVTECRLHYSESEVHTSAVDTANVAMINLRLSRDAFSEYSSSEGEIGLDIAKFKNIFSMLGKSSNITLHYPDGSNKIDLTFDGYKYFIALLDTNTLKKDPNTPNIELPGQVTLAGSDLYSAIKAAAVVSDKIWFVIDPVEQLFYINAEGDTDHIKREFNGDDIVSCNYVEAKSLFSIDYLKDMGKVMSGNEVTISLGINHPARFSFSIANGKGYIDYLIAPRIEAGQ
ncbi:MAG: DNA polymerase sliding clamp [Methanomicrobiales archaeon]|jgi:proliferating cell nuclear antigen|nr:DNA polymerase sliding clamp [Methanomicrobiales archaeon]